MNCSSKQRRRRNQRGYILLTLMLFVALLTIGMLAMVENIESQIKRDREEELIHRGVQYSRAVRHYFKKFGRYPNRIEDLENTNNYRSLRKRYKDPITGKDFKPLHITDVRMSFAGGVPGGGPPGGGPPPGGGLPPGGLPDPAAAPGGAGPAATAGLQNPPPAPFQTANQPAGSPPDQTATPPAGRPPTPQPPSQPQPAGPNGAPQTFGGGAIVGVASVSKDKTIREFNKKDHYNQWQFIYDPTTDRGGLLMTPNQPPLKGAVALNPTDIQGTPGQNPGLGGGQQGPGTPPPQQQPNPQPSPNQQ